MRSVFVLLMTVAAAGAANLPSADSQRGRQLFTAQGCIQCHSVDGQGGRSAPDLGRRIGRDLTPAALSATMWNHGPAMWAAMRQTGIQKKELPEQDAADLFAFFYSSRYFDRPGDAARGKQAFAARRCAECHGLTAPLTGGIPPVSEWKSLGRPVDLAEAMWNHAAKMKQEFSAKGIPWQELTSEQLSDILVYLRNLPSTRRIVYEFETTSGEKGAALFESRGCAGCHKGQLDLTRRLKDKTMTDIAVEMWNHAPRMGDKAPQLETGEMAHLVSHLWAGQFFADSGNASRGKGVFAQKGCGSCHGAAGSGAPSLAARQGSFTSASMVSALWEHGPAMLDKMRAQGTPWPRFTSRQMSDLIAYLNSPQ